MTTRGAAVRELLRVALDGLGKLEPGERDQLLAMLVNHVRSCAPEHVAMQALGAPTEPIRDPRGPR